jgi:hypothetical protein
MSKIFNIIFFIIINAEILYTICSQNKSNSNIVTIKFKTYYPYIENNNISPLNAKNYYIKIHSSKIYLELNTGDETSFIKQKSQILNTIINLKEIIFVTTNDYFEKNTEINNNLLCRYNTSNSETFYESEGFYPFNGIKSLCSYSKEYFKIYTDLSLTKYNITKINLLCTINHNISKICGNIGLIYFHTESKSYNFMGQLHNIFSLSDFTFIFNYSNPDSDEGIFIFGNKPHKYLPKDFDENNLVSIYSKKIYEFSLESKEIKINNNLTEENIEIKLDPDIEGLQFPQKYFKYIEEIFFREYYTKNICYFDEYSLYTVIICYNNFTDKMMQSFPKIEFKIANFSIEFTWKDLFYKENNIYYFRIIERGIDKHFDFGRILFKKYTFVFNPESRQIFFYDNKNNKELENKDKKLETKYIIIIVTLSIIVIILIPLGIYLGKQLYNKRKKKAYELNDDYDYTPTKENSEPLFKQ